MRINFIKVIWAGLVIDVLSFIVAVPSYKLFGWVFELEPNTVWKWTPSSLSSVPFGSLSISEWLFLLVINTALAIFIAFLYALFHDAIPWTGLKKGIMFGLLMYPMSVLLPVFSLYFLTNIAQGALVYFALEGLLEFLIYGAAISAIYRK